MEAKITDMHEAIEESLEDVNIVDIDYAHKKLSGISLDCLKRACKENRLTFAIGLPPRGQEFQTWRYLVDKRALDECLEGKRDLFK